MRAAPRTALAAWHRPTWRWLLPRATPVEADGRGGRMCCAWTLKKVLRGEQCKRGWKALGEASGRRAQMRGMNAAWTVLTWRWLLPQATPVEADGRGRERRWKQAGTCSGQIKKIWGGTGGGHGPTPPLLSPLLGLPSALHATCQPGRAFLKGCWAQTMRGM